MQLKFNYTADLNNNKNETLKWHRCMNSKKKQLRCDEKKHKKRFEILI
jgi:hypothetical protein